MKKGVFITFEGGDGSGKSTLSKAIYEMLIQNKHPALLTREPGGTPFAEEVRALFLEGNFHLSSRSELLAVLAARSDHVDKVIRPALEMGKFVLCDRFIDSTVVYQGYAAHKDVDEVRSIALSAVPLVPELTFLLDLEIDATEPRRKKRGGGERDAMELKERTFHEKTREGFLREAQLHPERIVILDGSLPPNQLLLLAWQEIESRFLCRG